MADETNGNTTFMVQGSPLMVKKSSCDKPFFFHQTFLKEEIQTKYVTLTDTILIFWQPYQIYL